MSEPVVPACRSCGAEIISAELNGEMVRVCSACGEPAEISVIEDSTANGFDPTAYFDR